MIILAGEHAVVHGYTAVASSIDLYTVVSLRLHSENEDSIRLQLEDVGLDFSWPIKRIKEVLSHLGSPFSSTPTLCSLETVKSITALVDEQSFPETRIGLASGVCAFLWLYTSILGFKPGTVIVTSELPLGAALGSSAAYCVALSAALPAFSDSMKLDVNKWAFEEEKIIHGRPFGVDNSVSTFARKSRHPDALCCVLNAIESISKEWSTIIQSHTVDDLSVTANEDRLRELMEMNQGLLLSIGVTHASIETVLQIAMKHKLASKLTGAGGGGCWLTFTYLYPRSSSL
ncbi:hypothetical protein Gorai_019773 [Gossypium raimondii]|uniref:Mevalonate kinase n=1 Tax=Gossypium raimondii TaxID=29730 RepID=A0A7J8PPB1_GOSRA|nr:hypothetical protein [Gossypium raimondii]